MPVSLAPELPGRERLTCVLVIQDHARRTLVGLGMPRADRRGRLSGRPLPAGIGTLRISAPAVGPVAAVFSRRMALAPCTASAPTCLWDGSHRRRRGPTIEAAD